MIPFVAKMPIVQIIEETGLGVRHIELIHPFAKVINVGRP